MTPSLPLDWPDPIDPPAPALTVPRAGASRGLPVSPCGLCKTPGGSTPPNQSRPTRRDGSPYGLPPLCGTCASTLRSRERRSGDQAADGWADEWRDEAKRRDARRIRMAYAGRLAREAGIDCMAAWKFIRMREEAGDIVLPANV